MILTNSPHFIKPFFKWNARLASFIEEIFASRFLIPKFFASFSSLSNACLPMPLLDNLYAKNRLL